MPFREYAPFFKPEEIATLTTAFDAVWQELSANKSLDTERKIALMRKKLATRILVSATCGVRDVDLLKEQALRSLRRWISAQGEQVYAPEAA